jgi:quercetin dioxygenase-like cupin family protein
MRVLITGVGADGRSCVVSEKTVARLPVVAPDDPRSVAAGFAGVAIENLYAMLGSPAPRPAGRSMSIDVQGAPGLPRLYVVDYMPSATTPLHHTDSVDFDVVLEGSVDVILDDGPHRLEAGDCVVVTGVDHGWQAGPEGCRSLVLVFGTPAPD